MSDRQENAIDRKSKQLTKEFVKGLRAASDEFKNNPPENLETLEAQIKQETEALEGMSKMFDPFSDFGVTLSFMRGHIAGLYGMRSNMTHLENAAKEAKKNIRQKEHEKAQKKAKENNRV